jgi:hypothetical protein
MDQAGFRIGEIKGANNAGGTAIVEVYDVP